MQNNLDYLKIDLSSISAGISHQKSNLVTLIRHCFQNNIKLCRPIFRLSGIHNNGKEIVSDLSEYYDFNKITVNGYPYSLVDDLNSKFTISKKRYPYDLLKLDDIFSNTDKQILVDIPYKSDITDVAEQVRTKLKDKYICVHVRRGDKIVNNKIDSDTMPSNILKNINNYSDITNIVYIMTNEINQMLELKNNSKYNFFFYIDFEELKDISNNYYLFCIENEIMRLATIRGSTFNTGKNTYYHFCLTDAAGWQ